MPSVTLSSGTGNWIAVVLQAPFYYDGTSNLIVSLSQINDSPGILLLNRSVTDRSLYANSSSSNATASNRLPNFGFDLTIPSTSSNDAGVTEIKSFTDTICSGNIPVDVVLKNFGTDTLVTVDINWNVNSVLQTPFSWVGSLNSGDSTIVTLANYNFLGGTTYNLDAYTSNPNGNLDTVNANDTSEINSMYSKMNPTVNLGSDVTLLLNQSITLDAGAGFITYVWSNGATAQTVLVDSVGVGAGTGVFSVEVTDAFGCKGRDTIQITFSSGVGIESFNSLELFNVFPNPATDKINITLPESSFPFELRVFNYAGKKVFETNGSGSFNLETGSWSSGMYTFMITHNGQVAVKKVIIH